QIHSSGRGRHPTQLATFTSTSCRGRIRFHIYQHFAGSDFGIPKIEVMQTCLNKLHYPGVRCIRAFAVLEYHHGDTDAVAPIQHVVRSESGRLPQDLTDATLGATSSVRNRTNLGVLANDDVHEVTARYSSRPTHQSIPGPGWTRALLPERPRAFLQRANLAPQAGARCRGSGPLELERDVELGAIGLDVS